MTVGRAASGSRDQWHPCTVALYITLRDGDGAVVRGMPDLFGGTFDASGEFDALVQADISPMLTGLDPRTRR